MQISRSEQKRRIHRLGDLVKQLATLGAGEIRKVPCPEDVQQLLLDAAGQSGGSRQRTLKYITKLLAREDTEALYTFLSAKKGRDLQDAAQFHELEFFRDQLLGEAIEDRNRCLDHDLPWDASWQSSVLPDIGKQLPGADLAALRRLSCAFAVTRNKAHAREIFRLLRAAREQQRFSQPDGP